MSAPRVALLRSRVWHAALAALLPVLLVALSVAASVFITPALIASLPLAILIGVFLAIGRAMGVRPTAVEGAFAVQGGAIVVGPRRVVARDEITAGVVIPGVVDGVIVRLDRKRRVPIDLRVADLGTGRAVLEELGLDPGHAVAQFPIQATSFSAWRRRMFLAIASIFPLLLAGVLTGVTHEPVAILLTAPLVLLVALSTVVHARLTVGSDGLSVRRFFRGEFIPLDGIADAVACEGAMMMGTPVQLVQLLDEKGAVVRELVIDSKKQGPFSEPIVAEVEARANALAERIREVIALRREVDVELDARSLARGDRAFGAWITELRGLLDRATGFRDAEPPKPEALISIVEDTSCPADRRVAAAIALARTPARERVRVAAAATAEPKLRIALEAALEDDEERLASALEELR